MNIQLLDLDSANAQEAQVDEVLKKIQSDQAKEKAEADARSERAALAAHLEGEPEEAGPSLRGFSTMNAEFRGTAQPQTDLTQETDPSD